MPINTTIAIIRIVVIAAGKTTPSTCKIIYKTIRATAAVSE